MNNLSSDVRETLIQAGWNPNNKVDLSKTVKFLEAMGYQVFDSVIDALRVFGGIEYKFKHPDGSLETFSLFRKPEEI
ncbi:SUKH-3 domain-containing protein [Paenibacillus sp. FSL L8-0436]|uniref:SUKH-3 domain-containing protein n=1 Tax=Paenibacillus sp. FSL L8-0436 TaxID=2954686 RepID=UPI00315809C7